MLRLIITALLACWLSANALIAGIVEIKGKTPADPREKQDFAHATCDRNILGLDYSGKYRMPLQALSSSSVKVVKILAIRVNFKKEEPDDPSTTGIGNFDLRSKDEFKAQEGHLIDPAPHNSDYFQAQLRALATFYKAVSNGRLELDYDVYPRATDSAYQLDSSMASYGLKAPELGLAQFVSDAMHKADLDSELSLHDPISGLDRYDAYIIFHAGSDQQNNLRIVGQDTPGDLYTGYVKLGNASFSLENGSVVVTDAVVMPETASQDGRVTALNAVMGHEFGHQLGLVDLYDTRTGVTQIGDFSMMDYNGFGVNINLGDSVPVLVQGVMPVFPDAWSRAYLGFVDVVQVSSANNIKIAAAEIDTSANQILMVPINADEYFLVENRRTDIDGDGVTGLKADSLTDVFLGPASPATKQLNREYDYLLPGSGMLIWHVDELVARLSYGNGGNNFQTNRLQWWNYPSDPVHWDNHHRFLTVEEADGVIDFGGYFYSGYGSQSDMFEINGNPTFGPTTNPPSIADNNAYTGITIGDISASLRIMSCDVSIQGRLPGWPNQIFVNAQSLTVADLKGDGKDEILTAAGPFIFAYNFDGTSLFKPDSGHEAIIQRDVLFGSGAVYDTLAVLGHLDSDRSITKPLAVADLDGDGIAEIVGVTSGNTLVCFTAASPDYRGEATKLFESPIDGPAAVAPIILDYDHAVAGLEILVFNENGDKLVFDKNGNRLLKEAGTKPFRVMTDSLHHFELMSPPGGIVETDSALSIVGAAAADFDKDGVVETAEVYAEGRLVINYSGKSVSVNVGGAISSEISLGDIDDDGYLEILFCGDNRIYAYNSNGTPVSNFPIPVNPVIPTSLITTNPALADINGDGNMEIFVGSNNGEVSGFSVNGDRLDNFPKSAGGSITEPVVFGHSGSTWGLFALTQEGEIRAFLTTAPQKISWSMRYGGRANLGSYVQSLPVHAPIADAIGALYNYPNPAKNKTTIRYTVRESGEVSIKLYNLAGDMVYDTRQAAVAGTDNEFPFDCSQLASGVYFCQLETSAGDRKHCAVAIVK